MNYYERHIGDYLKDTSHLSLLEHGVYTRLLDVYYTREGGIPADQVARLVGARSQEEREALEIVLQEFFVLVDGVYQQTRCEREIARYQDKQAKAKKSADARWSAGKPHCESITDEVRTNSERNANAMRTQSEGNAHQSPVTSNQTQELGAQPGPVKAASARPNGTRLSPDWQPSDAQIAFLKAEQPDADPRRIADRFRDYWIAVPGARGRKLDWDATWRNWTRNPEKKNANPASNPGRQSVADRNAATIAALTGRDRDKPPDIFGGFAERVD